MGHHSCCNQQKVKRGLWSPEEDEKLIRHITTHGHGCWSEVPDKAGCPSHHIYLLYLQIYLHIPISRRKMCLNLMKSVFGFSFLDLLGLQRCGKSCRLRWINYLRPDIRRGRFTAEEEKLIISLHGAVGNRFWVILFHIVFSHFQIDPLSHPFFRQKSVYLSWKRVTTIKRSMTHWVILESVWFGRIILGRNRMVIYQPPKWNDNSSI